MDHFGTEDNDWPAERVQAMAAAIAPLEELHALWNSAAPPTADEMRDLLFAARQCRGLSLPHVAQLLKIDNSALREQVIAAARDVHERLFARRIRLSDPLCPTNRCVNDCVYCPLRRSNTQLRRRAMTPRDLQREITSLLEEGHRQLLLVFGESRLGLEYVRDLLEAVSAVRTRTSRVQRIDVNMNTPSARELATLTNIERLGTYHLYQETYEPETYRALHPDGPKADYAWRLTSLDRAWAAGFRALGLGILLGLYDPHFDLLALLRHVQYLRTTYRPRFVAISLPRLIAATGTPGIADTRWVVDDEEFVFLVAVIRLALPTVEIILNTPAPTETRRTLYAVGISHVSVGSASYPGVYTADGAPEAAGRLTIGRPRNLETLVYRMCEAGFVPDFDAVSVSALPSEEPADENALETATARRVANTLLAFKEYLLDHASEETQNIASSVIQEELARQPRRIRQRTLELLEEIEAGFRGVRL